MMFRDTSNSLDLLRRHSKHSSATTTTSVPLTDFALSNHELVYQTTPTTGMTTFLPTLHSTPPMPTFQKPNMHPRGSPPPSPDITRHTDTDTLTHSENNNGNYATAPANFKLIMSNNNINSTAGRPTDSSPPVYLRRRNNNGNNADNAPPARIYIPHKSPETVDGYNSSPASGGESAQRVFFLRNSRAFTTTPLIDRIPDTPPLPVGWGEELDRLICKIDALGYDNVRIVQKLREIHPHLNGQVLTPTMIDRRLRLLDQDIAIDYWRAGLRSRDASDARDALERRDAARDLQDLRFAREGTRARNVQARQDPPTALQQRQGELRHQNWSSQYGSTSRHGDDASSPGLRGGGGDARVVTSEFMTGFRSRNG